MESKNRELGKGPYLMDKEPMLRMEHISKRFPGVQALDDVTFEVYPGEILGFLGENGAGKSTLVKILSGVYTKDSGTVWLNGREIEVHSPHDAQDLGISTIYQEINLVPLRSVAENIMLGKEPTRLGMIDWRRMNADANELLHQVGIQIDFKLIV